MPLYPFQADDGTVTEQFYLMRDAPAIGSTIVIKGKKFTRLASDIQIRRDDRYPHINTQLPPWAPGCKHDKRGMAIIESPTHEKKVLRRMKYAYE